MKSVLLFMATIVVISTTSCTKLLEDLKLKKAETPTIKDSTTTVYFRVQFSGGKSTTNSTIVTAKLK